MPYTKEQISLFGIALSMKKGDTPYSYSERAAAMAKETSVAELERMIGEGVKKKSVTIGK